MELENKKVGMFVAPYYEDMEFWYPYYRMQEEGAEVTVIGPEKATFNGKHGVPAKPDKTIDEVKPDDFDALLIPGGYAPDHMRRNQAMIDFVRDMNEQGKVIGAICHAGWLLASAGIINGRRLTSFYAIKDDLVNAGADWHDAEVAVDGNLVTSRQPRDLPACCQKLIEKIG